METARAITYAACRTLDAGAKNVSKVSAMCKYYAGDVAMSVTTDAVQVLGGSGYMRDYACERHARDARITTIYEGTSQLQVLAAVYWLRQVTRSKKRSTISVD